MLPESIALNCIAFYWFFQEKKFSGSKKDPYLMDLL